MDGITFKTANYSDILRILLLYLYGGIYFDLDVISVDGFATQLPMNFAVAEDRTKVNGAILRFSKEHQFLWFLMQEIVSNVFIVAIQKHSYCIRSSIKICVIKPYFKHSQYFCFPRF